MHLAHLATPWIGQVALLVINGQSAQALRIGRYVPNGVYHSHVTDIMNVNALLQAHDEPVAVEPHRQHRVRVAVVADLGALLEVEHAELARIRHANYGDQAARE